jgi:hypothetical protein
MDLNQAGCRDAAAPDHSWGVAALCPGHPAREAGDQLLDITLEPDSRSTFLRQVHRERPVDVGDT